MSSRSSNNKNYRSQRSSSRPMKSTVVSHDQEQKAKKQVEKVAMVVKKEHPKKRLSQDGYYVCLELPGFIAPTGLSSLTHYDLVSYKLENKWVWSPSHPSEYVSTYQPRNIRHVVIPLRPEMAASLGLNMKELMTMNAPDYVDGDPVPSSPVSVVIYPPKYVFTEIPTNRNLLYNANIYHANIMYIIKGQAPKTSHQVLPFDRAQVLAGITEEAIEMGFCREDETIVKPNVKKAPIYRALTSQDKMGSFYIKTLATQYRVLTNLNQDSYPIALTLSLPSTWIWNPGNPDSVPAVYTPPLQVVHVYPIQPDSSLPIKQIVIQPPILSYGRAAQDYPYHTPHYKRADIETVLRYPSSSKAMKPNFFVGRVPLDTNYASDLKYASERDYWYTGLTHEGINTLNIKLSLVSVYFLIRLPSFEHPVNYGPQYPSKLTIRSQVQWIYGRRDESDMLPILYTPIPIASLVSGTSVNVKTKPIWVTFPTYVVTKLPSSEQSFMNLPRVELIGKVNGEPPRTLSHKPFFNPMAFAKGSQARLLTAQLTEGERMPVKLSGVAHSALTPTTGVYGHKAAEKYFYQASFDYLAPLSPAVLGVKSPFLPPDPWMDHDPLKLLNQEDLSEEEAMCSLALVSNDLKDQLIQVPPPSPAFSERLEKAV